MTGNPEDKVDYIDKVVVHRARQAQLKCDWRAVKTYTIPAKAADRAGNTQQTREHWVVKSVAISTLELAARHICWDKS